MLLIRLEETSDGPGGMRQRERTFITEGSLQEAMEYMSERLKSLRRLGMEYGIRGIQYRLVSAENFSHNVRPELLTEFLVEELKYL